LHHSTRKAELTALIAASVPFDETAQSSLLMEGNGLPPGASGKIHDFMNHRRARLLAPLITTGPTEKGETSMKAIKAAAIQAAPVYLNLDASIAKAAEIVSEAARNGAKLVAFPETWLPGYPFFVWLGAPAEGIRFIPQYHANSMELHSSETKRLQKIAAANEITLVMGYSEREGGSRYMSQVIIGEQGEILLNRRKLKPTHVERTVLRAKATAPTCALSMPRLAAWAR
jgi:Carbon-nitrogen hydrolase